VAIINEPRRKEAGLSGNFVGALLIILKSQSKNHPQADILTENKNNTVFPIYEIR
jgi:hypothetical protein